MQHCKVIPSKCLGAQHRLLVMNLMFKSLRRAREVLVLMGLDGGTLLERTLISYRRILNRMLVRS